ncbi:MAG TPA: DUF2955 domain-containing protein [Arenimonas sp.]|nr:DUF2955 domain-containing protein [Arenimonas sp.]
MHQADKAVLRLTSGLALSVFIAYGLALSMPFMVCVLAIIIIMKPGPAIPFIKGLVISFVFASLLTTGVLMIPILENYAFSGVLLTSIALYAIFFWGMRSGNPLTIILVIAITLIPVIGVAEQALVSPIITAIAVGIAIGVLVNGFSHAFFPDDPKTDKVSKAPPAISYEIANWIALRAAIVVMPAFLLALINPSVFVATIMKTVALAQQAGSINARNAGQELVGSTLMGALLSALVWSGLSLWPTLWMLVLWLAAAAMWAGQRLYGIKASKYPASYWSNALITLLILVGPAIEDSATGKDVTKASFIRIVLFIAVALYAWATVWALERWRTSRKATLFYNNA